MIQRRRTISIAGPAVATLLLNPTWPPAPVHAMFNDVFDLHELTMALREHAPPFRGTK